MKCRTLSKPASRSGLTILEVIISIGIFLASATIVTQLLGTGTSAALAGRRRSQMCLLAETKMAEITAGIRDMTSADNQNFETDEAPDGYSWSVSVEDGGQTDLMLITVTVEYSSGDGEPSDQFRLARMMRDPQAWIDAAEAAAEAEEDDGGVL